MSFHSPSSEVPIPAIGVTYGDLRRSIAYTFIPAA